MADGGAICWGVYEDRNDELVRLEVENASDTPVRLTVVRPRSRPEVIDVRPRSRGALYVAGVGKRLAGDDEGEIDLPVGLVVMFQHARRSHA